MNEVPRTPPGSEDEQRQCVQRYETMVRGDGSRFFDVEELALIMGHYLDQNDVRHASEVLQFAFSLHPGSVDLRYWEAQVHIDSGRLSKAMEVLEELEKLEPYNEEILLHKAGIFSQQRNYRRAIEHYRRALELAQDGLDEIYLDLAFEHENLEEFDEAIDCLKKALEIAPENEAVLYELAYAFDLAGAHDASIVFFRHFTNEHPYSAVAWYDLGNALAAKERLEESNEALDLALAIDEKMSAACFSKARNLVVMARYEEAIVCYRETLTHDGPQAITFSYIGECFEKMERFEQALIHYDQSLALDPAWVDAWVGRGVVKDLQGRLTEALKDLEYASKLQPDNADAWFYLGNVLGRMTRYDEAFAAYTRLNTIEPQSLEGWLDHADLLLKLKGPEAALAKLREGSMVHQLDARFKYRLVSYLLRAGREQQALLELEEALMADHAAHTTLLDHYPEAAQRPQVMHLVALYKR